MAHAADARVESLNVIQSGYYTAKTTGEKAAPPARGCRRSGLSEPGVHDPETGYTYRQSRNTFEATVGDSLVRGYTLEKPYAVIRGTWRLELLQDGRKLLESGNEKIGVS